MRVTLGMNILAIDIGGTHIKIMSSGEKNPRKIDSGPTFTAKEMAAAVKELAEGWNYDAISMGYPGPVLRNRPVAEPHNLGGGWVGFDYARSFGKPVKIINDAAMQALGSYKGGKMLFLGLGTGLGSCMIVDAIVEPMELGHLPYRRATFEDYIGIRGLEKHGIKKWEGYVADIVRRLVAALEPNEVILGGGNVNKLEKLPPGCRAGDNANAFQGGFRLWDKPGKRISSRIAAAATGATLALLLCAGVARGQEIGNSQSTNAPSGLLSQNAQNVSVNLRPFQPILARDHLFDDWYGLRSELEQIGITTSITYISDIAGNPSGGK